MASKRTLRKAATIILSVSIFILAVSIVFLVAFPSIYNNQLEKQRTLQEGTLVTDIWKDIPLPIYLRLYLFNITNGEDFVKGSKLNASQVGPYTYRSHWVKHDIEWHDNSTVSYKEVRTYHFVPEKSVGSEDDVVYTLNGPMIVAADMLKEYGDWPKILASIGMGILGEHVVIQKSVRQLAFEGYEDEIIRIAPILKPVPFKGGIFSWLYGKNATNDGVYNLFTGEGDGTKAGIMDKWRGENKLPFWSDDSCNMLNGTNIETGPPITDDQQTYTFYQSILCRSWTFDYTGNKTYFDVLSKRFEATPKIFANSTENPDNYCFETSRRLPSGVQDIGSCQYDAPIILSFPHFLFADPSYLEKVNGLNPNREDHISYVDVEPITGVTIGAHIRFQLNLQMVPQKKLVQFQNIPDGVFPLLWADIELSLNEEYADFLKDHLRRPKIIAHWLLGTLIFVSAISIIGAILVLVFVKDDERDDPLLNAREDNEKSPINNNPTRDVPSYGTQERFSNSMGYYPTIPSKANDQSAHQTVAASAPEMNSETESSELYRSKNQDDDDPILNIHQSDDKP